MLAIKKQRIELVNTWLNFFFLYRNGIAFNVAHTRSLKLMLEAVGNYGPHLKASTYHELRVLFLKKKIEQTNKMLKSHKEDWVEFGCSIMSDAWTDWKNRNIPWNRRLLRSLEGRQCFVML